MKRSMLVLALLLLPGVTAAQDGVIQKFTPADLEKVLKDDLKKDFAKKEVDGGVLYDIKGTPFFATLFGEKKFMLFFARGKAGETDLKLLNDWNRDAVYSRVYRNGETLVFEVPLGLGAGTTPAIVRSYYENTEREFENFAKALKAAAGN